MSAPAHLEPRLLRAFVTVAEELHFTRAAARLYVAQQALSRDVRRLERDLGCELFVRSTRRVTLTADGERLLPYARAALQAQDDLLTAARRSRPLLVDLNSRASGPTARYCTARVSGPRARADGPLRERTDLGGGGAARGAARRHVRPVRGARPVRAGRTRPAAGAVRADGRAAAREPRPGRPARGAAGRARGETVYAGAGNTRTEEWTDLARRLFDGWGITLAPPVPLAVGEEEFQRVTARAGRPVLAVVSFPPLPGTVSRPLVEPVPLSPVSLVWRKGMIHPALVELRRSAAELAAERGWLERPVDGWLPGLDADVMGAHPMSRC